MDQLYVIVGNSREYVGPFESHEAANEWAGKVFNLFEVHQLTAPIKFRGGLDGGH